MKRSTERILTTHCGSLPRPPGLMALLTDRAFGRPVDEAEFAAQVEAAVKTAVGKQVDAGIDVVSDGEMSKIGFYNYVTDRLSGFGGESSSFAPRDLMEFPEAARRMFQRAGADGPTITSVRPGNDAAITYRGHDQLRADLANLKTALQGQPFTDAFIPAVSPGTVVQNLNTTHYSSRSEYLNALAEALREEYLAIVRSGFVLQLDCPDLAMDRHVEFADAPIEEFRKGIGEHVEVVNQALLGIDPEQVRVHVCWGNYPGPHHLDVPLEDILDIVYGVNASGISIEGANPRHEHEYRVFRDHPLPDGKFLIPGVIDTVSTHVEHPRVVADRIRRYAEVVGRENVMAGTDCGFATVGASYLAPETAYAKLETLVEGARVASAELWSPARV